MVYIAMMTIPKNLNFYIICNVGYNGFFEFIPIANFTHSYAPL